MKTVVQRGRGGKSRRKMEVGRMVDRERRGGQEGGRVGGGVFFYV